MNNIHRRINSISCLKNDQNQDVKDENGLGRLASNYFSSLFTDDCRTGDPILDENLLHCLPSPLNMEDNDLIMTSVIEDEVRNIVFSMGAFKALSLDGFPLAFFQDHWDVVGSDVVLATKDFFRSGKLLKNFNSTSITLVPKIQESTLLKDFRPISLCNTIYKISSKVLVNRLKPFLDFLICPSQKGFVPGRKILDATISTHEVIHSMDKIRKPGMVLKLDIFKAYDRVK